LWSWLNANGGTVATIATVITALVAVAALIAAARDSGDRTRPYMAAEFIPAPHSESSVVLRVVNYGATVARDVAVTFTPALKPRPTSDGALSISKRYAQPIPHVSPGQVLANGWQTWNDKGKLHSSPDLCTVTITYRSGRRTFIDEFTLDVETVAHANDPVSSKSELGSLRRIALALEKIAPK
jgi:hypothetical protein